MEVKLTKIDTFGRIVIPAKWRKEILKDSDKIILIKEEDRIILIPFRDKKLKLTDLFDSIDLGVDEIKDWNEFEKIFL